MKETASEIFHTAFNGGLEGMFEVMSSAEQACLKHGISQESIYVINLCLEELITNALRYGSPNRKSLNFEISLCKTASGIILHITDDANPFDPLTEAPAPDLDADIEHRKLGGLGIFLLKTMTKSIKYDYRHDRNNILINI